MNWFLLLGIIATLMILIPVIISADAQIQPVEKGKNYDQVLLSDDGSFRTYKWTSHPDRISNDDINWYNYFYSDTGKYLRFESAALSFEFYPNTSDFKVWNGGLIADRLPTLPSVSTTLKTAPNGTDIWTSYHVIPSQYTIKPNDNGLEVELIQDYGDVILRTHYNPEFHTGMKWTWDIENINLDDTKFGVTTTCHQCGPVIIDGFEYSDGQWSKNDLKNDDGTYKSVSINGISFDPQDYEHDYLWAFKNENGNTIFDFTYSKGALPKGQTLVIDPTFGWQADDTIQRANSVSQVSSSCHTTVSTVDTSESGVQKAASGNNSNCSAIAYQWDLSSISGNIIVVSDVRFRIDIDAIGGSAQNCNVNDFTYDLTTATNQQIWDDARNYLNGTAYISNDAYCASTGNQKTLDLGTDADSDLQTQFNGGDKRFAVGVYSFSATRPAASWQINVSDAELEITYTVGQPISVDVVDTDTAIVGDVSRFTGFVNVTSGINANITSIAFIVNGTTQNTNSTGQNSTSTPYGVNIGPFWYQMTTDDVYEFEVEVTVQNQTDTETSSEFIYDTREYDPNYFTATVASEGLVNYTTSRSTDQDDVFIKVNRDKNGATFNVECLVQSQSQAIFSNGTGTWINVTGQGYYNETASGFQNSHLYGVCYNDNQLFTFVSYTNSSLSLLGIDAFDTVYGDFIGVPVGIFFLVLVAAYASPRTAPIWLVVVLAMAGVLAATDFITLSTEIWALALVAGILGLFVGRKFF